MNDSLRPAIDLHIDEVVLHGFEPASREAIGEGFRLELARLLGGRPSPGLLTGPGDLDRVDAGSVQLASGVAPRSVGAQLAGAVFEGLDQ